MSNPPLTYDGGLSVQIQNKLSEKGWSHQSYRFLNEYIKRKLRPDGTAYQVSLNKYVTSVVFSTMIWYLIILNFLYIKLCIVTNMHYNNYFYLFHVLVGGVFAWDNTEVSLRQIQVKLRRCITAIHIWNLYLKI